MPNYGPQKVSRAVTFIKPRRNKKEEYQRVAAAQPNKEKPETGKKIMSTTKPETLTIRRTERNMAIAIVTLSAIIVIAASVVTGFFLGAQYEAKNDATVKAEAITYAKQIVTSSELKQ